MGSEKSPLRVACCLPSLSLDATARGRLTDATCILQEYIAAGLRGRGHAVTMMAPDGGGEIAFTRDLQERTIAARTWSRSPWFRAARSVAWRLQRLLGVPYLNVFSNYQALDSYLRCLPGHDLVHERNSLFSDGAAKACRRLGLPYVLFFEADEILEHDVMGSGLVGLLRWRAQNIIRHNLNTADRIVCVSAGAKARLEHTWKIDPRTITVLPNAADVDRFRPGLDSQGAIRRLLAPDGPLIIFVGGFYQWHDVETLLAAFAELVGRSPTARLVLVGDGARRAAMETRAAELGIGRAVVFKGAVAHREVPSLIDAADIAVAPYKDPGHQFWLSPLKVFEYMAAGTSVVATRIGHIAEVIRHDYNGLLVPPGDAPALAAALARLIDDAELRKALAGRAREDAVRQYSWAVYVARLEEVYRQAIDACRVRAERAGTRRSAETGSAA